jgi:hypothetical protein
MALLEFKVRGIMAKLLSKLFWMTPAVVGLNIIGAASAFAQTNNTPNNTPGVQTTQQEIITPNSEDNSGLSQVTSVSQLSDVQPTDWAFQALQSLVERYGCIAGYPDGTFKGNRALTRYEFAAGLNACLDRINELIATSTANFATKEDLETIKKLQDEFSAEIATLRGRVDNLEAKTAELEANQFSTTTKLVGEVIFSLSDVFGEKLAGNTFDTNSRDNRDLTDNAIFSDRVRLVLNSSFTGKDQLQVRLNTRNIPEYGTAITGTDMTRLSYAGNNENNLGIDKINYAFNFGDGIRVKVDANNAELFSNVNNFNPDFASDGKGAISRYGRFSPIYRQSQGGAGVTVEVNPKGSLTASAAYLARTPSNPNDGFGAFNGDSTIFGQLAFKPTKNLGLALAYAHTYDGVKDNDTIANNTNTNAANILQGTGSVLANRPFGGNTATTSNNYGVQASFKVSSKLTLSGWAGYTNAIAESGVAKGRNADIFYWAANLGLKDFGGKGNVLGVIFGQPPKVTENEFRIGTIEQKDSDTSYHLEGLYRMQFGDNISVTPGLLVIFNPEHNENNDPIYVGTLRTTFSF